MGNNSSGINGLGGAENENVNTEESSTGGFSPDMSSPTQSVTTDGIGGLLNLSSAGFGQEGLGNDIIKMLEEGTKGEGYKFIYVPANSISVRYSSIVIFAERENVKTMSIVLLSASNRTGLTPEEIVGSMESRNNSYFGNNNAADKLAFLPSDAVNGTYVSRVKESLNAADRSVIQVVVYPFSDAKQENVEPIFTKILIGIKSVLFAEQGVISKDKYKEYSLESNIALNNDPNLYHDLNIQTNIVKTTSNTKDLATDPNNVGNAYKLNEVGVRLDYIPIEDDSNANSMFHMQRKPTKKLMPVLVGEILNVTPGTLDNLIIALASIGTATAPGNWLAAALNRKDIGYLDLITDVKDKVATSPDNKYGAPLDISKLVPQEQFDVVSAMFVKSSPILGLDVPLCSENDSFLSIVTRCFKGNGTAKDQALKEIIAAARRVTGNKFNANFNVNDIFMDEYTKEVNSGTYINNVGTSKDTRSLDLIDECKCIASGTSTPADLINWLTSTGEQSLYQDAKHIMRTKGNASANISNKFLRVIFKPEFHTELVRALNASSFGITSNVLLQQQATGQYNTFSSLAKASSGNLSFNSNVNGLSHNGVNPYFKTASVYS